MNQDMIHYSWKESTCKARASQDAILHTLLLSSSPTCNTPLSWSFKQHLLQGRQKLFLTKMYLDNPNQSINEFLALSDPKYNLSLERGVMLRTQALTALAYDEAIQQMQSEESLLITNMKRRFNPTNNLPLGIHIEHDDTLQKRELINTCKDEKKNNRGQRDPTNAFPCILHEILSNPDYSQCITWLPHGRAWRIIRRKQFERIVIPRHFRHGRYSSFMRQVNGWRFQRITEEPDHNAYHHELFRKDSPHLCLKMRRPASSETTRSQVTIHSFSEMQSHRNY